MALEEVSEVATVSRMLVEDDDLLLGPYLEVQESSKSENSLRVKYDRYNHPSPTNDRRLEQPVRGLAPERPLLAC